MPSTSKRTVTITYSGDVGGTQELEAADNTVSPAQTQLLTLASGSTTITVPTGGSTPKAVTIMPPADNTTSIELCVTGVGTGIRLHNTDPTSLAFHSTVASFDLKTGATITGVRLFWS